jgi:hypothetical protein
MSSFVPGVLALVQGLGQDPGCYNATEGNATVMKPLPIVPNFSVSTFFILMCLLLCCSISAFTALNFSDFARKHRKQNVASENTEITAKVEPLKPSEANLDSGDEGDNLRMQESTTDLAQNFTSMPFEDPASPESMQKTSWFEKFDREELVLYFITFWLTL